ncbi:MAG: methionyl-tRNA formyltransferase [Oscillospiraceae bacterium]|jgi:methionyl-tRNA formyltransferase|nr:methionyl-tRNA formyltransferase [Oscillospiraceae bacterium]
MDIVFMGTPDFAATILEGLLASEHRVLAVFSQPDKPQGRGHKVQMPPVKVLANRCGIPVFQPASLRCAEAEAQITACNPDLVVVAAYGKILPASVLKIPRYGCVNVHGSLLPKYRGAAPIQWAVINGERETGISIMYMEEGLDSGDLICQRTVQIREEDTAKSLYLSLAQVGKGELLRGLELISDGGFVPKKQDDGEATFAPLLSKGMACLDFNMPAQTVLNWIRGLDVWPVAQTEVARVKVKVWQARIATGLNLAPGEWFCKKKLVVGCWDFGLELLEVQPENGRRLKGADFVNRFS